MIGVESPSSEVFVYTLELKNRIITAVVLLGGFLGLLWCSSTFVAGRFLLLLLVVAMVAIATVEWSWLSTDSQLLSRRRIKYTLLPLVIASFSFFAAFDSRVIRTWQPQETSQVVDGGSGDVLEYGAHNENSKEVVASVDVFSVESFILRVLIVVVFAGWFGALGILVLSDRHDVQQIGLMARELLPAVGLLGVGGASAVLLICLPYGLELIFYLVATVASCDSAAYFGGRRLQGVKLSPAVSPGKTVSGSVCGTLAALVVGAVVGSIVSFTSHMSISIWQWVALSAGVALSSQIGDLTKSFLKRIHGKKDSSNLLPGHGGVFDRIDGYLGSAPLLLMSILLCR